MDTSEKNMIYCSYCGYHFSKKTRKCPQCNKKHSKPFYRKWWFWLFILIVVAIAFFNTNEPSVNTSGSLDSTTEQIVMTKEEYISSCSSIPYKDIARNPNNYIGQKAVFQGEVIQVQDSDKKVVLRVNVTQGEYGLWEDTVYVEYQRKNENESRILEEDIITLYGEIKGIKDYTAVFGNQISIPHLIAEYIDINE